MCKRLRQPMIYEWFTKVLPHARLTLCAERGKNSGFSSGGLQPARCCSCGRLFLRIASAMLVSSTVVVITLVNRKHA